MLLSACQHALTPPASPAPTRDDRASVALLVPLGAEDPEIADLGGSLENGARLAIPDIAGAEIDLRIYPTLATSSGAAAAAAQALEDGADIILGPLYSETTAAVAPVAAEGNISVLSFSNDSRVAGGNVFVLGLTLENAAAALIKHANLLGKTKPMVVHADNYSGGRALEAVRNASESAGISFLGGLSYERSKLGVVESVERISNAILSEGADIVVFSSDSAGALPLLAQLLPENGVNPEAVKFAGLARWDIPAETLELEGLQGGWFALPDPNHAHKFGNRFEAAFGERPHPLASLAYDGMAAIGALVSARGPSSLNADGLSEKSGFRGVNGVFRFKADGTNERMLAVAEVVASKAVVVAPPRKNFAHAGF